MDRLIERREAVVWVLAFAGVSAILVAVGFTSDDPDSALYAALAARLADGPATHWIAPEWWGHWDSEGWFREHPVGVLLLPTLLGAVGVPGVQAAYIVGMAAGLLCLVLLGQLVRDLTTRDDGRAALVLLQLMPMASIFRIRANHEYPMLACLLLALIGADLVRHSWRWVWVLPAALAAALLIKGVFVLVPMLAVAVWIAVNPRQVPGHWGRAVVTGALALVVMILVALVYDVAYLRATGERFWAPYWARQLAPLSIATPLDGGSTIAYHLWFYGLRVLWHPAPWSLALGLAAWTHRRRLRSIWEAATEGERRGFAFALVASTSIILMLVPASRFAERYIFAANYLIATAGIVVALRMWPELARACRAWDRAWPAFPVLVWLTLAAARLVVGPLLPRISG